MDWGIPMWFLPALFCVIMLDYFISKTHFYLQVALSITLPVLGYSIYKISGIHLPWSLDVAMVVYLFYFIGRLLRNVDLLKITDRKEWFFIAVPFILHFGIAHFAPSPSFYYGEYGILPLTYITGLLGFVWLFSLLKLLPAWKPFVWVGQNTLPILAFHVLAMTFIKSIAVFVFNTQIVFNFWNSLGFSVLQILLLVPVILFLNNHLPFLVGKANPKKDLKKHPDKAI